MEKSGGMKSKNKILKLLPKAAQAAALSFQNPHLFSPSGSKWHDLHVNKLRPNVNKGISGPIVSMIPLEARRRSTATAKNSETREPTSPKVSCMGQIKHRKEPKLKTTVSNSGPVRINNRSRPDEAAGSEQKKGKKKKAGIRNIFSARRNHSDASAGRPEPPLTDRPVPGLSQMRRFASSRDTFANFDWTKAQVAPGDDSDFCSDSGDEGDVIIPFSAPILLTGNTAGLASKPRKEINLWKRRTMTQPKPLHLIN